MQVTSFGQQYVASKEFRAGLLELAIRHIHVHRTPVPDVQGTLSLIVARTLAAPSKRELYGASLIGIEAFEEENAVIIEPIIKATIEAALVNPQEMGF